MTAWTETETGTGTDRGTRLTRLALAALVSGAAAGLLATSCLLLGAMTLGGWSWAVAPAEAVLAAIGVGLAAGLAVATPPAFLAGAAMCALGRRVDAARSASAWAAAGAAVGTLCWALLAAWAGLSVGEPGLTRPGALLPAAILTGAGAALAFRAVARPARRRKAA